MERRISQTGSAERLEFNRFDVHGCSHRAMLEPSWRRHYGAADNDAIKEDLVVPNVNVFQVKHSVTEHYAV